MDKKVSKSNISLAKLNKTVDMGSQLMSNNLTQIFKIIQEKIASIPDDLPIKEELEKLVSNQK